MNEGIKIIEAGKVADEIARRQAIRQYKRMKKQQRDERLALLMMVLAVPVTYLVFWLLG